MGTGRCLANASLAAAAAPAPITAISFLASHLSSSARCKPPLSFTALQAARLSHPLLLPLNSLPSRLCRTGTAFEPDLVASPFTISSSGNSPRGFWRPQPPAGPVALSSTAH